MKTSLDPPQAKLHREIEAVTFDLWGTLIELAPEVAESYTARRESAWAQEASTWAATPGIIPEIQSPKEARAALVTELLTEASRGRSLSIEGQGRRLARLLGRQYDPGGIARRLDLIFRDLPIQVVQGARDVLSKLEASGLKLGVVSNLVYEPAQSVRDLLADLHLLPVFQHVTLSEELPWCKPSPQIFHSCLSGLGVSPRHAIHVGDSLEDIEGATRTNYLRAFRLFRAGRGALVETVNEGGGTRVGTTEIRTASGLSSLMDWCGCP